MPSFADIKAKAIKAKDASVSKVQDVKARNTSVPLKKTNWDPYSKQPAPPPPAPRVTRPTHSFPPPPPTHNRPSSSTSSLTPPPPRSPAPPSPSVAPSLPTRSPNPPPMLPSRSSGPPPLKRSTRPDLPPPAIGPPGDPAIDWANLSPEDKKVFFSWLDEFFAKFFNITIQSR